MVYLSSELYSMKEKEIMIQYSQKYGIERRVLLKCEKGNDNDERKLPSNFHNATRWSRVKRVYEFESERG